MRNAVDRYAICPWMPLKYNEDGSLDIYIQNKTPGPDRETNWLLTPGATGLFNLTIRNYWPKEVSFNGAYKNPPVKMVE